MDDETILASRYQEHYKGKIGYEDYKSKMIEPIRSEEQNKITLKKCDDLQKLTVEDIYNYLKSIKDAEYNKEGKIDFYESLIRNIKEPNLSTYLKTFNENDAIENEFYREENVRKYSVSGKIGKYLAVLFKNPF